MSATDRNLGLWLSLATLWSKLISPACTYYFTLSVTYLELKTIGRDWNMDLVVKLCLLAHLALLLKPLSSSHTPPSHHL